MKKDHRKVIKRRQRVYGPSGINMRAFGMGITALLEAHFQTKLPGIIPPHVASSIHVQSKLIRSVLPFEREDDSRLDLHAYTDIADDLDPRPRSRKKKSQ